MAFQRNLYFWILISWTLFSTYGNNTTTDTLTQMNNSATTPSNGDTIQSDPSTPPGGQNGNSPPGFVPPEGDRGNRTRGARDGEDGGGGGGGLKAGLIVLLLAGIAILIGLITCFVCYVRKGKSIRKQARKDARQMRVRGELVTNGSALYLNRDASSPSFFTTSRTTTDKTDAAPDLRRKIYKATVGDAITAVVCETRAAPGTRERSVDVDSAAQNVYSQYGEGGLDHNSNKPSPEHTYASIQRKPKEKEVDESNPNTDPANHLYSEIDESPDGRKKKTKNSPSRSNDSGCSNDSGDGQYETINEDKNHAYRQRRDSNGRDSDTNYDVIDNSDVVNKKKDNLAPPSGSEDEHSVIEQFDEVLEKFENECSEKASPARVPRSLRVRRDSWVQEEGDEIDLATLRQNHSDSPKRNPLKPGSLTDVRQTPPSNRRTSTSRSTDSPSKSSIASGGSARSCGSSGRSEKADKPKNGQERKQAIETNSDSNITETENSSTSDGDVTDRDKLHDVNFLTLPPLPAGSQLKSQTQTDSFTAAPPTAAQVRRDSLLGSLPPLEPVAFDAELTADLGEVFDDTPFGRQSSKRKKKLSDRKYSVDQIDNKSEKQKDKSHRAKLVKSGSLDDFGISSEEKTVPPDLLLKRRGSLKGHDRRENKTEDEHKKHNKDRTKNKNSPHGSPSKKNSYKFKEIKKQEAELNSTAESVNLDQSMRHKASQLVKNAIDNAREERKTHREKKSPEKTPEKKRNTFKDLYDMVNWGAGVEETLREKHSGRAGRKSRRHSVDQLDSEDDGEASPRSGSRERLTPRSRDKRRSKRESGHVSDDEMLSARSKKKRGHGLDNLGFQGDKSTHHKHKRHHQKKDKSADDGSSNRHHKQKHHRKHRGHRREGETEEEYQERKRRHMERKKHRKHHHHHHKRRHHSRDREKAGDEKEADVKLDKKYGKNDNSDPMNSSMSNIMYGSGDSFSDTDSELSGGDETQLNNSQNKGKKDSWFGASNPQKNSSAKQAARNPNGFQIEDMELDNSFEV